MPLYKAFGLYIRSEIDLPELILARDERRSEDVNIRRAVIDFPPLHDTFIMRRGVMAQNANDSDGSIYLRWGAIAGYRALGGDTLLVDSYTEDAGLLSLFTISEALGSILFQRGLFLLHASAVQMGSEAYVFAAAPGTGKSTTAMAFVQQGAPLLSDDLTAICFDAQNRPYVLPAYPQIKIWETTAKGLGFDQSALTPVAEGINKFAYRPDQNFPGSAVPLAKIFLLDKSPDSLADRRVSAIEAPVKLVRDFPLDASLLRGSYHQRHFWQSGWCTVHAEVWCMHRPEGFAALSAWVTEERSKL